MVSDIYRSRKQCLIEQAKEWTARVIRPALRDEVVSTTYGRVPPYLKEEIDAELTAQKITFKFESYLFNGFAEKIEGLSLVVTW